MSIRTRFDKHLTLAKIIRPQILKKLSQANHNRGAIIGSPPGANVGVHAERRVGEKIAPFPEAVPKLVNPHFPHPSQMPKYQQHRRPTPFPTEPIQPGAKEYPATITEGRGEPWTRQWPR
ncbi:uncharacterized protein LOC123305335 [Chrysoperla carnea]|uniref:uncharacterized protein LOC123305335 n=1 Tax=Chrysoperla carnea TaxID=189513 RepID=UPI001D077375|nr:uncharacterized protein LOC123305335 [Chrysoperla carnea]